MISTYLDSAGNEWASWVGTSTELVVSLRAGGSETATVSVVGSCGVDRAAWSSVTYQGESVSITEGMDPAWVGFWSVLAWGFLLVFFVWFLRRLYYGITERPEVGGGA